MRRELILSDSTKESVERYLEQPGNLILLGNAHLGKSRLALNLAEDILRQYNSGEEICEVALDVHPDFAFVGPVDGVVRIEQIRAMLDFTRYSGLRSSKKVVVIDDADSMSMNSQNALLKILEDDSERIVVILVAHRALLDTIHSRCRVIHVTTPLNQEGDLLSILSQGRPGLMENYRESEYLKEMVEVSKRIAKMQKKREFLEIFCALREKDKNFFFEKYGCSEVVSMLYYISYVFRGALGGRMGENAVLSPEADNLARMYSIEEICSHLLSIEEATRRMMDGSFNKNDFNSLLYGFLQ